jgi:hypothetical protein
MPGSTGKISGYHRKTAPLIHKLSDPTADHQHGQQQGRNEDELEDEELSFGWEVLVGR